jgi:hypothetical protein
MQLRFSGDFRQLEQGKTTNKAPATPKKMEIQELEYQQKIDMSRIDPLWSQASTQQE